MDWLRGERFITVAALERLNIAPQSLADLFTRMQEAGDSYGILEVTLALLEHHPE
ncbi:MAG: hypothetical protein MK080_11005 [Opitutales bacterium]|nr:hypothetical protein [Opitutales bacterium]NRA27992.1 hypothetical protein [Opitutales bacterium]